MTKFYSYKARCPMSNKLVLIHVTSEDALKIAQREVGEIVEEASDEELLSYFIKLYWAWPRKEASKCLD